MVDTMKRKIEEAFLDKSLGFPVLLTSVPMRKVRGEWVLDLPLNEFQQVVLWLLAHRSTALTGKQVRFVRHWMQLTQREFADLHDVSHACVSKWEAKEHQPTGMAKPSEILLRLNILTALPAELWERLDGPNSEDDKPSSLRRLLEEVSHFESRESTDQPVTVPEKYLSNEGRLSPG